MMTKRYTYILGLSIYFFIISTAQAIDNKWLVGFYVAPEVEFLDCTTNVNCSGRANGIEISRLLNINAPPGKLALKIDQFLQLGYLDFGQTNLPNQQIFSTRGYSFSWANRAYFTKNFGFGLDLGVMRFITNNNGKNYQSITFKKDANIFYLIHDQFLLNLRLADYGYGLDLQSPEIQLSDKTKSSINFISIGLEAKF